MALAALACFAVLLSPAPQVPQTNAEKLQLYDRIRKCTVKVYAEFGNTQFHGTGIGLKRFGDYVIVVTNSHVVAQSGGISSKVRVKPFSRTGGQLLAAYVLSDYRADDLYLDLAFLVVRDPGQTISIAEKGSNPNWKSDRVYACGNPEEEEFLVDHGNVLPRSAAPNAAKGADWVILHDALIERGNSGGGLFDSAGKLVGINTWLLDGKIAMAIDFDLFEDLFDLRATSLSAWTNGWSLDTSLPNGSSAYLLAVGTWTPKPAWPAVNAGGFSAERSEAPLSEYPYGALLVRSGGAVSCFNHAHLGLNGATVYADARTAQIKEAAGGVFFRINDNYPNDNSGVIRIFYVVVKPLRS